MWVLIIPLMLQWIAFAELLFCWILWSLAFLKPRKQAAGRKEIAKSPTSTWGILLVMVSFALVWAYVRPADFTNRCLLSSHP
jgi:hypothetical protein